MQKRAKSSNKYGINFIVNVVTIIQKEKFFNYDKHLLTKKHVSKISKSVENPLKKKINYKNLMYLYCDKSYKSRVIEYGVIRKKCAK